MCIIKTQRGVEIDIAPGQWLFMMIQFLYMDRLKPHDHYV